MMPFRFAPPPLIAGVLVLAALLAAPEPLPGQDDPPFTSKFQNAEEGDEFGRPPGGPPQRWNSGDRSQLTEEQQERLRSIQEKMKNNPEVEAAREAIRDAQTPDEKKAAMKKMHEVMKGAMSPEDRKFVESLPKPKNKKNKDGFQGGPGGNEQRGRGQFKGPPGQDQGDGGSGFGQGQGEGPGRRGAQGFGSGGGFGGGPPRMSEEQRARLKSIREKYKDDPEVKAARQAVQEAITPEEKEEAVETYRTVVQKKMSPEDRQYLEEFRKSRQQLQQMPTRMPGPGGPQ